MTGTGPEATLPDSVVQGIAAIRAGRTEEALGNLLPLVNAGEGGEAALLYAGVAALLEGRADLFFDQLVPAWEASSGDSFSYVNNVGQQLFWIGKQEVLERALEACPEAWMLRFPPLYFAACMAFRADEAAAGFALAHHMAARLNPKPRIASLTQTRGLTLGDFVHTQESIVPKLELMKKASAVDKQLSS